jgi:hypothetical protein
MRVLHTRTHSLAHEVIHLHSNNLQIKQGCAGTGSFVWHLAMLEWAPGKYMHWC